MGANQTSFRWELLLTYDKLGRVQMGDMQVKGFSALAMP